VEKPTITAETAKTAEKRTLGFSALSACSAFNVGFLHGREARWRKLRYTSFP